MDNLTGHRTSEHGTMAADQLPQNPDGQQGVSYRAFNLEIGDFAIVYTPELQTGQPD